MRNSGELEETALHLPGTRWDKIWHSSRDPASPRIGQRWSISVSGKRLFLKLAKLVTRQHSFLSPLRWRILSLSSYWLQHVHRTQLGKRHEGCSNKWLNTNYRFRSVYLNWSASRFFPKEYSKAFDLNYEAKIDKNKMKVQRYDINIKWVQITQSHCRFDHYFIYLFEMIDSPVSFPIKPI